MVSKGKQRFPVLATVFFIAVAAWAAKHGYDVLAEFFRSLSAGTSNGEPEEGSPDPSSDEERAERKARTKKRVVGALFAIVIGAAVLVGALAAVVFARYLFNNLEPGVVLALIAGLMLLATGMRAVYRHSPLSLSIAIAFTTSLASILFMVTTTLALGHPMQFPVFDYLEWGYVLLLSNSAIWILAIMRTLYMCKALGIISALTITVALLLLAYPSANLLYNDIQWDQLDDASESFFASLPTAEAQPDLEESPYPAPINLGYWVEIDDGEPAASFISFKLPIGPEFNDEAHVRIAAQLGSIYITGSDDKIVACWPYSTPDNFFDRDMLPDRDDLNPDYVTVQNGMATVRLRLWSSDNLKGCTFHFDGSITDMSTLHVLPRKL